MKKILVLTVLFLGFFSFAFAGAVTLTNFDGTGEGRINNGALRISDKAKVIKNGRGSTVVYDLGACNVLSINMYAPTSGDNIAVFDLATPNTFAYGYAAATAVPEFEIAISANTSTVQMDTKGAPFTKGIYVLATDTDVLWSVVYDY